MDDEAFLERLEDERGTQLDRLGSSKLLIALTEADLTAERVLAVAANSEHSARRTFEAWADDEDHPDAREAFADHAAQEAEHYERVADLLDDHEPVDGGAMHAYLRGREDTVERVAAGLVGRPLYSVRAYAQIISFFVNEPDESTADVFRALRADTEESLARGTGLLEALCEGEDDWERAAATAGYAIQLVYDDYADTLASLGVDVKSVC